MSHPAPLLNVISRLDGYGGARLLRYFAAHQARAGRAPRVAALAADPQIVRELREAGVDVAVLAARWGADPVALGRLARLRRQDERRRVVAWDLRAWCYARCAARGEPATVAALPATPLDPPPAISREAALAELQLPADARVIAVVGPLTPRKQVDEAIWAYELVRVLHADARLVVFGDGPDRHRLERYATLVSEPGCVRFAGYRADLPALLPHVDVYWQLDPSASTPYGLLEAMAAARPVVASHVPAHRAALAGGHGGSLVARGDRAGVARATDLLLQDAAAAQRLGAAARAMVERSWSLATRLAELDAWLR